MSDTISKRIADAHRVAVGMMSPEAFIAAHGKTRIIELEIGQPTPEPVISYNTGAENLYITGVSGLCYFWKCL